MDPVLEVNHEQAKYNSKFPIVLFRQSVALYLILFFGAKPVMDTFLAITDTECEILEMLGEDDVEDNLEDSFEGLTDLAFTEVGVDRQMNLNRGRSLDDISNYHGFNPEILIPPPRLI